jgi:hypothetical protein
MSSYLALNPYVLSLPVQVFFNFQDTASLITSPIFQQTAAAYLLDKEFRNQAWVASDFPASEANPFHRFNVNIVNGTSVRLVSLLNVL